MFFNEGGGMKKGFTLLELIVVIIILGILAALGFGQYTKMIEKGRTAEAKVLLGQIRSAQAAYFQEYSVYTTAANLAVTFNTACDTDHFFSYAAASTGTSQATRCTAGAKHNAASSYSVTLTATGTWGGDAGYY